MDRSIILTILALNGEAMAERMADAVVLVSSDTVPNATDFAKVRRELGDCFTAFLTAWATAYERQSAATWKAGESKN